MDVAQALDAWTVPAPAPGSARSAMARFSEGADHARRRAMAEQRLASFDPGALRADAKARTAARLTGRDELDVMAEIARHVPVAVLAGALGASDAEAVVVAARRLALALAPPGGTEPTDGRAEVATLATLLGMGGDPVDEEAQNVVALLFQALDATAGLVGNALRDAPGEPRATIVHTARMDPGGTLHLVDLAGADPPLPFGAGRHRCPGEAHALALAAGILDALADAGAVVADPEAAAVDESRANLRIPATLVVRLTRCHGTAPRGRGGGRSARR